MWRRIIIWLLFSFLSVGTLWAQQEYKLVPVPQAPFESLTLPVKRAGKLLLIEAKVDTLQGYFILDLGAPCLVLNSTYFRNYTVDSTYVAGTVTGFSEDVRRCKVDSLQIRELSYQYLMADVTDLGHIENRRGVKILGLLGVNLFLNFRMDIDIYRNKLELFTLDKKGRASSALHTTASDPGIDMKFSLKNNVVLIPVVIGEEALLFSLDTGAEITLLDNDFPSSISTSIEITRQMTLQGASGASIEVFGGRLMDIQLDNTPLRPMKLMITDLDEMGKAYGSEIDGMIGFGLIKQGRVSINFMRKELNISLYNRNTNSP